MHSRTGKLNAKTLLSLLAVRVAIQFNAELNSYGLHVQMNILD